MLNNIFIFALGLWGIIALLFTFIFKMITFRLGSLTFTVDLTDSTDDVFDEIYTIRTFCEFCGIEKNSTVEIINHGANDELCNKILEFYDKYDFVKISE